MTTEKLSEHFTEKEMQCHCGCGRCELHGDLLPLLEKIRAIVNRGRQSHDEAGIIVNSGYRCPKHNAEVGGVENSPHTLGMAADIRTPACTSDALWLMVRNAWADGDLPELGGLGRYDGRIHVDVKHAQDGHLREWDNRTRQNA